MNEELSAKSLPRKIETEEENERILQVIEKLMDKDENILLPEEETLLVLLSELVEEFEEKHYPKPNIAPHERLKYLLAEKNLKQKDLCDVLGRIETEEQNEFYLSIIQQMMNSGSSNFSPEEHALFDSLVLMVEEFESKAYPVD